MSTKTELETDFQLSKFIKGLRLTQKEKVSLARHARLYAAWVLYYNAKVTCGMAAEMYGTDYRTFLDHCWVFTRNEEKHKSMNQVMEEAEKLWDKS